MSVRDEYFQLLHSVSAIVHKTVAETIALACDGDQDMLQKMMWLPNARKGKGVMRAVLTKLVYDVFGGPSDFDLSPALALQEISNVHAYLANILLDNKQDIYDSQHRKMVAKINNITITTALFREVYEQMIFALPTDPLKQMILLAAASQAIAKCNVGQNMDVELTIDKINQFRTDEEYTKYYIQKSQLQSGYHYGYSALTGAVLAGAADEEIELAYEVGETLGVGLHISNDFGDFAILAEGTGFKTYQDQFADLRNGRLSLPIYLVLRHGTSEQRQLFYDIAHGKVDGEGSYRQVTQAIHDAGVYQEGKRICADYAHQAKRLIHQLPASHSRDLLSAMSSVIRSNKYLFALKHGYTPAQG